MGDQEDYEAGVRDGQRGGLFEDFCQGQNIFSSKAYNDGYSYGVDNRYKRANDPKPESSSRSFWGSGNSSESSSDSSDNSNSSSSSPSYSGGGGGGGDYEYSGGGGGGGDSEEFAIGCLRLIGISFLLLSFSGFFGGSKNTTNPQKNCVYQRQNSNLSLEEKVQVLSAYLRNNNQLCGNFNDYRLVIPPRGTDIKGIEIAYVGSSAIYVFHSSDNGNTWGSLPATNPFLRKLIRDYEQSRRQSSSL